MGRWEQGENIGSGKFGVVYACRPHGDGDYLWAMKRLQNDMARIDEVRKRFAREIAIQAGLSHENVMPVVDSGEGPGGIPWFVMDRATAGSLKDAIDDGRSRDHDWAIRVFVGMLAGMSHAHESGVLHRDLKPGNVLLFGDMARISDFGVAKQLDLDATTLTLTAQELGTLRYMAPEQIADAKRAGPPADVFALGKILAYMLTGRRPAPGSVDLTDVPEDFRFFIDKSCRDDPARRYPDAGVALVAFNRLLSPAEDALPAAEAAKKLVDSNMAALGTDRLPAALDELRDHFRTHPADAEMYRSVFPHMKPELVRAWLNHDAGGFAEALGAYDQHAAEHTSFSYGDVIARFYKVVFDSSDDLAIQGTVLAGLIRTGYSLNRFYVGDVVTDLLASLSKPAEVELAVETIDENQIAADWYAEATLRRPLRGPIADALRRAQQAVEHGRASSA